MSKSNRSTAGVLIAAILVVAAGGLIFFALKGGDDTANAEDAPEIELVEVLVLTQDIEKGTRSEALIEGELSLSYEVQEFAPENVLTGAVQSVDELEEMVEMITTVDMVAGEQLLASRFVSAESFAQQQSPIEIPDDLYQVTVSLDPQRALGGNVRAGDTVAIVASYGEVDFTNLLQAVELTEGQTSEDLVSQTDEDDTESDETGRDDPVKINLTQLQLHNVLVTNVQTEVPQEVEATDDPDAPPVAPAGRFLVTLGVSGDQAETLIYATEFSNNIWLVNQPVEGGESGPGFETIDSELGFQDKDEFWDRLQELYAAAGIEAPVINVTTDDVVEEDAA